MSAYTDRVDAARNTSGNLYRQVAYSAWIAARDIITEPGATPSHAARLVWANKLRFGGISAAEAFAARVMPQVLLNATIPADPETATDEVVQTVVSGLVNQWIDKG